MNIHRVYVGIGSNIEQEKYIRLSAQYLRNAFGDNCDLQLSPVYKTRAVGFDGDDFYNLVACFDTDKSAVEVEKTLKQIEHENGRQRKQEKFSARTLDIDLLLYDQEIIQADGLSVPRDEIEKYAFVLSPLADLAPELLHPQTGKSMAEMWQVMQADIDENSLQKIDFNW